MSGTSTPVCLGGVKCHLRCTAVGLAAGIEVTRSAGCKEDFEPGLCRPGLVLAYVCTPVLRRVRDLERSSETRDLSVEHRGKQMKLSSTKPKILGPSGSDPFLAVRPTTSRL